MATIGLNNDPIIPTDLAKAVLKISDFCSAMSCVDCPFNKAKNDRDVNHCILIRKAPDGWGQHIYDLKEYHIKTDVE